MIPMATPMQLKHSLLEKETMDTISHGLASAELNWLDLNKLCF